MTPPLSRDSPFRLLFLCAAGLLVFLAATPGQDAWTWVLPDGVEPPLVPADNPMTRAKVELGRHLFYDPLLSGNRSFACATCHTQALGFADSHGRAVGSTGESHVRGAPGLANVAWIRVLTWADPRLDRLEDQARVPIFNEHPVEMGMAGREAELVSRLRESAEYPAWFAEAFPGSAEPVSLENVTRAVASFQRSLVSFGSPWDRAQAGDEAAMSPSARRGEVLFGRLGCGGCHVPPFFTSAATGAPIRDVFFNTGLYDIDGEGAYPPGNEGLHALTGMPEDMGRFRTPSLRNVAVTAPYMHDGSLATLNEVVDFYGRGGRLVRDGPYQGDGFRNPYRSPRLTPFTLSLRERTDLVGFLRALTDESFLSDPAFSDPW